jgi:hypothetical protein
MMAGQLIICSIAAVISLSAAHIGMAADEGWSLCRDFSKGRCRAEITSTTGTIANQWPDHEKDYFVLGSVEYEWPIHSNITCSLRGTPAFVYGRHRDGDYDSTNIYGAALGPAFRLYQNKDLTGFFVEAGSSVLWQSDYLPGNSSKLNFISDAGIGCQFRNHVFISVKYFHISNAGLEDLNSGIDALGASLAYAF